MEIFDVFSMNGIVNYPAAGEFFLENVILKVSQTHFSKDFYPKGGPMPPLGFTKGGINFSRGGGGNAPPPRGGCEVPCLQHWLVVTYITGNLLPKTLVSCHL